VKKIWSLFVLFLFLRIWPFLKELMAKFGFLNFFRTRQPCCLPPSSRHPEKEYSVTKLVCTAVTDFEMRDNILLIISFEHFRLAQTLTQSLEAAADCRSFFY